MDLAAIEKAAKLILGADFMVAATGAGMSADSGLPVYKDTQRVEAYIKRKLSYMDLCTPRWNFEEPETFYGFWGASMKQFRDAIPHRGYDILRKWRDQLFSASSDEFRNELAKNPKLEDATDLPGPFFVYTSNVDALHLKAGFHKNEVYEIHGNIETWQCSRPCTKDTWSAPADFEFKVDPTTMLAERERSEEKVDHSKNNGFVSNHPRCKNCGDYARPAILMFGDFYWVRNKSLWTPWQNAVFDVLAKKPSKSMVIVEVGCGKNVPSVRCMGEVMINSAPHQVHVIRINMDFVKADFTMNPERVIGIQGRGKEVLEAIDDEIQALLWQEHEAQAKFQDNLRKLHDEEIVGSDSEDEELAYELKLRASLEETVPIS